MTTTDHDRVGALQLAHELRQHVLEPMKQSFVGKDEIIDLLGLCLVARENMFLLGPPGTAKSALVQQLARRIDGRVFDYLLTRFTEPNEIFGPFDIRKLREGELETNTEGMLPEADFVFLDELLNSNSAILNSLLLVLNERVFRRGRETRALDTLMVVGASNHMPEDDALQALIDRFLVRVGCYNVPEEELSSVLTAGWALEGGTPLPTTRLKITDARRLQALVRHVDLSAIRPKYAELVRRLRKAGLAVSDRRAVKLQSLMAASAVLCGRMAANQTDVWVLRYVWNSEEEQDILASLVKQALEEATPDEQAAGHPQSLAGEAPDAEQLASDLKRLGEQLAGAALSAAEQSVLQDKLALLTARCQWVKDSQQRTALEEMTSDLWNQIGASA